MTITQSSSLFDTTDSGHLLADAVGWLHDVLLGSVATGLAILAVAILGFLMLSGRLALREGLRVVLGCFVLFGAPALAIVMRNLADEEGHIPIPRETSVPALSARPLPSASAYDPYAGASLRDDRPRQ